MPDEDKTLSGSIHLDIFGGALSNGRDVAVKSISGIVKLGKILSWCRPRGEVRPLVVSCFLHV